MCLNADALRALTSALDAVARVFEGHQVLNVTPRTAPNKGDAVAAAVKSLDVAAALYVGDDVTDEDVFRCAPPHWVTARVQPSSAGTAAQFRLDAQHEVSTVIAILADLIEVTAHV